MYFENYRQRQQYHYCLNRIEVGDYIEYYVSSPDHKYMMPRTYITAYTNTDLVKQIGYYPDKLSGRIGAHIYPRIGLNNCYAVESMVMIKRIIKQQKKIQLKTETNYWDDWDRVIYSEEIF